MNKYINRELNWLEFNYRVFEEANDSDNPLLERLKFISIVSSNLDEFFMVRIASLYDQIKAGFNKTDISGLTPKEQFDLVVEKLHKHVSEQYKCYRRKLRPLLTLEGINILKNKDLTRGQKESIGKYYNKNIFPVLTPMVVDVGRRFPLIMSKSLNIALLLENNLSQSNGNTEVNYTFATVQVPSVLNRLIKLNSDDELSYIMIEDVIRMHLDKLFSGHRIICSGYYRITRNADSGLNEEGAEDLLEAIKQFLKMRKRGAVIRLEIEKGMDERLVRLLKREFDVPENCTFNISGPIDFTFLMEWVLSVGDFVKLRYEPYEPRVPEDFLDCLDDKSKNGSKKNIFDIIKEKDKLIHHPYESFNIVIDLIKFAADDPDVLAIKQTLYRVSGNSPIVDALIRAAENKKQVTVLVELKARFDEENNIQWAKRLEMAGCHVIYGLVGLKIHCKMLLIVRREKSQIKRYVHLSTGNYNDETAKIYTDIGFFTCDPYIGTDVSAIFNRLSGYSNLENLYKISVAPMNLRKKLISLINNEIKIAKSGKNAYITMKVNSLVDKEMIDVLYNASNSGVNIDLIIRGICCLKPGVKDLSENITVRSIVGRFLEHTRIFYYYNGGNEIVYLSSADLMNRNFDRRIETLFPIESKELIKRLKSILDIYLKDNVKARIMSGDGSYKRFIKENIEKISCQDKLYYKEMDKNINEEEFNK